MYETGYPTIDYTESDFKVFWKYTNLDENAEPIVVLL